MLKFLKNNDGLVTVEWVGISAVMILAAIGITAFVMQGADGAGNDVQAGLNSVNSSAPELGGVFGNGSSID